MKLLKATFAALLIALAIVIGANPKNVYTQTQAVLYGSFSNAAKAVTVTTDGYLNVTVQSGGAGVVAPANGGTGIASYAVGDLLYASGATTLSKLADVAVGSVLISGGVATAPSWSSALGLGTCATTTSVIRIYLCTATVGHSQVQFVNTGTAAGDYMDYVVKSGTTVANIGASNQNYGAGALGSGRSWLDTGTTVGNGWDYSASASNGNHCWYTGSYVLRVCLDSTGLTFSNMPFSVTAGTADTTTDTGSLTRVRYQATITPASGGALNCATQAAGFKAASTNADCPVITIPAGSRIVAAYADVTAGFTCSGTCSGTKVFRLGISAGGVEVFATSLNVAATATYGLADADMGSSMTRAAQIQGAYTPSWSATTTLTARFTSGTGNWGDASTTFVNAGSIKFTIITEQAK